MATALGSDAVILVGTSDPPATAVGLAREPKNDTGPTNEDTTTNDTGDGTNRDYIRDDSTLAFNTFADPADAGQVILNNAVENKTKVWAIFRPQGTGSGLKEQKARYIVETPREGYPLNGRATVDWTLKLDGVVTRSTQ